MHAEMRLHKITHAIKDTCRMIIIKAIIIYKYYSAHSSGLLIM